MGEKVAAGGGMADDMGESMQCSDHPYRRNPSGICAFCLQEKLGKLVSSSKSADPFFSIPPPPSSSSSPPSFTFSDNHPSFTSSTSSTRISFLSAKHRRYSKKGPESTIAPSIHKMSSTSATDSNTEVLILKRSKSVAPRHRAGRELTYASGSPRKKSLWSFLTFTYYSSSALIPYFSNKRRSTSSAASSVVIHGNGAADLSKPAKEEDDKTPRREQELPSASNGDGSPNGSQASSSFGRKVARSRSVGCGSRSFSGDFLERISNGFGDCTLRRVESHRESKPKSSIQRHGHHLDNDEDQQIKERVKCGGIFVGLGMVSSSANWLSAADSCDESCRMPATRRGGDPHGRSKSWGWAFASPMRVFRPGGNGTQSTIIATGGDLRLPGSNSPIHQS